MSNVRCLYAVALAVVAVLGCGRAAPQGPPTETPEVVVTQPVVKEITDYEDFTGTVEAIGDVAVRARVTGYLDKVLFTEGTEVKQGQPLFLIDPRTYEAELRRAEAEVLQARARLKRLNASLKRAADLLPAHAISQDDYETILGEHDAAEATVKFAEAARDLAELNLKFTTVTAPISGLISHQRVRPGNMVKADDTTDATVLTTIVSQDPVYATFDVDMRTMLRVRRLIQAGKMKSARNSKTTIYLGAEDEKEKGIFPHEGTINFIENRVEPGTGTLRLRGVFPNPDRLLSPGLYVHIRVPIGEKHSAVLIEEEAKGSDQGQDFVYVVNDKNEVTYRSVVLGASQQGLRVVEEGLKPGERVVLSGLQRIRPGMKVEVKTAQSLRAEAAAKPPLATKPEATQPKS